MLRLLTLAMTSLAAVALARDIVVPYETGREVLARNWGTASRVILYDGPDFSGRVVLISCSRPICNVYGPQTGNIRASSLLVERGMWKICSLPNLKGECSLFAAGEYPNLAPDVPRALTIQMMSMQEVGNRLADIGVMSVVVVPAAIESANAPAPKYEIGSLGFNSVSEALNSVKVRPGITVRVMTRGQWTVIDEPDGVTHWLFSPPGHPAHPAAYKLVSEVATTGGVHIRSSALCEGDAGACQETLLWFTEYYKWSATRPRGDMSQPTPNR